MYKKPKFKVTTLRVNKGVQGETLEQKLDRIVNNGEKITDTMPMIYTERKDGVQPQYDIRTDRFEIAVEGMDKVQKSYQARREEKHSTKDENGGTEPIQGTDNK